jgi:hypothetical protein
MQDKYKENTHLPMWKIYKCTIMRHYVPFKCEKCGYLLRLTLSDTRGFGRDLKTTRINKFCSVCCGMKLFKRLDKFERALLHFNNDDLQTFRKKKRGKKHDR